ncbi:hypothetical protein B0H16DRAFT_1775396 [Mycena metata]|uniref:Uncharacterized protein n=1 Tax=Mycena metata TaxID=1033252 RepID=A0AAD7HWV6_9AGAR|nr:hypothetical protein B0H16DRAFT_1775396 [Mycena metata]
MHPFLRVSNLSKLPTSTRVISLPRVNTSIIVLHLKQLAYAAASSRRTYLDVRSLSQAVSDLPDQLQPLALPAFYVTLDPSDIPVILEGLDSPTLLEDVKALHLRINQVDISLLSIATLLSVAFDHIPPLAFLDLWPRTRRWIDFRCTYQEHLPAVSIAKPYTVYLQIFWWFARSPQVAGLVNATPGVLNLVGRVMHESDSFQWCKYLVHWFQQNQALEHRDLEELIMGAGGTRRDLASVILLHLNRAVPTPEYDVTADSALNLLGALLLVREMMDGKLDDSALRNVLLSQGIVTACTTISRALARSTHEMGRNVAFGFLATLVSGMMRSPAHPRIAESLRAGLVPAIFSCSSGDNESTLVPVLQQVLPPSTVYHSVLSQLRLSLSDVRNVDTQENITSPTLLQYWQQFLVLAEHRLDVMKEYDAGSFTAPRTCGNLFRPLQFLTVHKVRQPRQ